MSEKKDNLDELIPLAGDTLINMTAADLEKADTQTIRVPRRFHMKMLRVIRAHGAGRRRIHEAPPVMGSGRLRRNRKDRFTGNPHSRLERRHIQVCAVGL